MGPLDRPKRVSRFVLEVSWASFVRFLLPKMALGGFRGRLWLVLGAPEGLFKSVLASDKLISIIKTALPSFDTLFFFVVVVAAAAVVVIVVVVAAAAAAAAVVVVIFEVDCILPLSFCSLASAFSGTDKVSDGAVLILTPSILSLIVLMTPGVTATR